MGTGGQGAWLESGLMPVSKVHLYILSQVPQQCLITQSNERLIFSAYSVFHVVSDITCFNFARLLAQHPLLSHIAFWMGLWRLSPLTHACLVQKQDSLRGPLYLGASAAFWQGFNVSAKGIFRVGGGKPNKYLCRSF